MVEFAVYKTESCPWCVQATDLLTLSGYDYDPIDVRATDIYPLFKGMGLSTVPQVFRLVNNSWTLIGGYEQLKEHLEDEL